MIIESGIIYRSIAAQNEFSFSFNGQNSTTSGISSFGFSGDNGSLDLFTFNSGKIRDVNARHVWSYNPRETVSISGNIGSGYINYFINQTPVCLFHPKDNNFYYDNFYITTENSSIDFDLSIKGSIPNYKISFPDSLVEGEKLTGYISNLSSTAARSFKAFSGSVFNNNDNYFINYLDSDKISGSESGLIVLENTQENGAKLVQTKFTNFTLVYHSNFGVVSQDVSFNLNPIPIYFTDFLTGFTGILESGSFGGLSKFYNYELQSIYPTQRQVDILVENVTGHTGEKYFEDYVVTGNISGELSGFIYGNDYITGSLISTGYSANGAVNYYGNLATGLFTYNQTPQLTYATGYLSYNYNILLTGGSGIAESTVHKVESSGFIDYDTSDFLVYKSRNLTGSGFAPLTGDLFGTQVTGNGTGYATGIQYLTGDFDINYQDYFWQSSSSTNNKVYGVTGITGFTLTEGDSGVYPGVSINITQSENVSGVRNLIPISQSSDIGNPSGSTFASENSDLAKYVFTDSDSTNWFTNSGISSGYIGFGFDNFSPQDSGIITHYEIDINKNFDCQFLPYQFSLSGSNDGQNWTNMDSRENVSFYNSSSKIFEVQTTGIYNKVRLDIELGIGVSHINPELITSNTGLYIEKIKFYEAQELLVFRNIVPKFSGDVATDPTVNSGQYIYTSTNIGETFVASSATGYWNKIAMSFDGKVQAAVGTNTRINLSYDSGQNWIDTGVFNNWQDVCVSSGGQYISAVATNSPIYISSGSGSGFESAADSRNWSAIDMSYDGSVQTAVVFNGDIYNSTDSGRSWTAINGNTRNWTDVSVSPQGRDQVACVFGGRIYQSSDSGKSFSSNDAINSNQNWTSVAIGSGALVQTATASGSAIFTTTNSGSTWTEFSTSSGDWSDVDISFDGKYQVASAFGGELYISEDSGSGWSATGDVKNWNGVAISSGGAEMSAAPYAFFDSIFASDFSGIAFPWWAGNTDKVLYPYVQITGTSGVSYAYDAYIGFKSFEEQVGVTGFSIDFEAGSLPEKLIIEGSLSGDTYTEFYKKDSDIQEVESGFLESGITGSQYFRFRFTEGDGGSFGSPAYTSEDYGVCYSGWEINTGLGSGVWGPVGMSRDGRVQVVSRWDVSGDSGPVYTGYNYISHNYGRDWFLRDQTGSAENNVQFVDISVSQDGEYMLAVNNMSFNQSITTRFIASSDSGVNWSTPGDDGYWLGGDMSSDGQIQIAVGGKFNTPIGQISDDYGSTWSTFDLVNHVGRDTGNAINDLLRVCISDDGYTVLTAEASNSRLLISGSVGQQWSGVTFGSNDPDNAFTNAVWRNVDMSSDASLFTAVSQNQGIWTSSDLGHTWSKSIFYNGENQIIDRDDNWTDISVSSDSKIQVAIQDKNARQPNRYLAWISTDSGESFRPLSGNNNNFQGYGIGGAAISESGNFQLLTSSTITINPESPGQSYINQNPGLSLLSTFNNCAYGSGIDYPDFQPLDIKVKNINFSVENLTQKQFNLDLVSITGSGHNLETTSIGTGFIYNEMSVYEPAVFYQTGIVSGTINAGSGSFTWDLNLQSTGVTGYVYLAEITGYNQASGSIVFLDTDGSGLTNNDLININQASFRYSIAPTSNPYQFSSPEDLINKLNSGASGGYADLDSSFETSVGVSGYKDSSILYLQSSYLTGEDGNNIKLTRNSTNLDAIKIPNRYLQSGVTYRAPATGWTGNFIKQLSLTVENSGDYSILIEQNNLAKIIQDVFWVDEFNNNYEITTGFLNPFDPTSYSGVRLPYDSNTSKYSGTFTMPSGQSLAASGLNIDINKINPYNSSGSLAKYIVSGESILFTGIIEG